MAHIRSTTKTQSATATSVAVTLTAAVPTGRTLLIAAGWEAVAGTVPTISSVVDSRGNTYATDVSIVSGTTVAVAVIRARVTTALQVNDTITVTISASRTRWALQVDEFDDVLVSPLDKTATSTGATVTAMSTGTTAATTQASELLYAVYGFGGGRTVTLGGSWSGGPVVESTAGSSDRAVQAAWQYVTATGTQQGTATLSTASTYAGAIATYKTVAPPTARISQVAMEAPLASAAPLAHISQVAMEAPRGITGEARISQVSITVPSRAGQRPYSGIKSASGGSLWDAAISAAVDGAV